MPNWLGAIDIGPVRVNAYSSADAGLADGRVDDRVERLGAMHLEHGANLKVILQVLADRRVVVDDGDPAVGQDRRRPDARELEEARRVDRAGGEQDLRVSESVDELVCLGGNGRRVARLPSNRICSVGACVRTRRLGRFSPAQGSPWRCSSATRCAG